MLIKGNLYAYEETLFNESAYNKIIKSNKGLDINDFYSYIEPDIFSLGLNRYIVFNQDYTQLEIFEDTDGLYRSLLTSHNEELLEVLKNYIFCKQFN